MSIGSQLKIARKAKGITQTELGEVIGRTKSTIANYESDKSGPSADDLLRMMAALDVDANFIYEWDSYQQKKPATEINCDELSDKEKEVALAYRLASEDDKAVINAVLKKYVNPTVDTARKVI